MRKFDTMVCAKLNDNMIARMDVLIEKSRYDSRSGIIRRAVQEFLERKENDVTIIA
jgi:metal-responsive CopG/Arc/MetJ family transcriptional regulator